MIRLVFRLVSGSRALASLAVVTLDGPMAMHESELVRQSSRVRVIVNQSMRRSQQSKAETESEDAAGDAAHCDFRGLAPPKPADPSRFHTTSLAQRYKRGQRTRGEPRRLTDAGRRPQFGEASRAALRWGLAPELLHW